MRAVKKLKYSRAAGCDDIPPELLKCALPHVAQALQMPHRPEKCYGISHTELYHLRRLWPCLLNRFQRQCSPRLLILFFEELGDM